MNKNRKRVVIIAPLPNLKERVRLNKLTEIMLDNQNINIDFWGWDRKINSEKKDYVQVNKRMLLTGGGEGNRKLIFYYLLWIIKVFINIMFKGKKDDYFYCLGFDTAFPASIANLIVKRKFIFDNADNISKSYKWPKVIEGILVKLEMFCSNKASFHLVPGQSRVDKVEENTRVIPNTPTSSIHKKALDIAREKGYRRGDIFTIYINGYLTKARGIEQIYHSLNECKNNVNVIIAGYPRCEAAHKLIELPNVHYYGNVSNEEALALYYNAHLAFTFYDPLTKVNRLAEPNKWGDCLATQTPLLANLEIITAKEYFNDKACFGVPYYDTDELTRLLDELSNNLNNNWTPIFENFKTKDFNYWDSAMNNLLNEFLNV